SVGGVGRREGDRATMTHASMRGEARAAAGIPDSLARLSVGIEHADDRVSDVLRALEQSASAARQLQTPRDARGDSQNARGDNKSARGESRFVSVDRKRREKNDVVLLGVGSIGRELLSQLAAQDAPVRVCGLVDRSGFLFD